MIKIEDSNSLVRDPKSRAIINTDKSAYAARKKALENNKKREEEIEQLKSDVSEIKNMLTQLLQQNQQSENQ